jgi:hypothetical protein
MKPKHIMIDIETLGKKPGCIVTSIGACVFSKDGIGETFQENISIVDSQKLGLTMDASTVFWWMQQDTSVRKGQFAYGVEPGAALMSLYHWVQQQRGLSTMDKENPIRVWGNGASFDVPILEAVYEKAQHPPPWLFWESMCYRTLKNQFPAKELQPPKNDKHHDALADAIWQAEHLINIYKTWGFEL